MAFEMTDNHQAEIDQAIERVLDQAGFKGAVRAPLAQDASTRSYERINLDGKKAMLMIAPPGNEGANPPCPPEANEETRKALGWNALSRLAASRVEAFVAVGDHLNSLGFSAPKVLAVDAHVGVAVLEDLGNDLYADIIAAGKADEVALYHEAGATLAALHAVVPPKVLASPIDPWPILDFDAIALRENANLFVEYTPKFLGRDGIADAEMQTWSTIRDALIGETLTQPRAFTLRDYHAENILWLPEREGIARVGLLDFQDAVLGYRAWDFAMLLHDARRDVSPAAHSAAVRAYLDTTGASEADFSTELAIQGAINALRILGIFSRLVGRDGKQRYREFMPREAGHLASVMGHPRLKDLKQWVEKNAPLDAFAKAASL